MRFSESGKREVHRYNEQRLIEEIVYEDGTSRRYGYSKENERILEEDRRGGVTRWGYDGYGRKVYEEKADGFTRHWEYDGAHDLVREWDSEGRETRKEYDRERNLVHQKEWMGREGWKETFFRYDEKGRIRVIRDGRGRETLYRYEERGAYPRRVITPKGEETVYEYDKAGRRVAVSNPYGRAEFSYNSRNFITKRRDGEGNTSRWIYDQMGHLESYYPAKQ